MSSPAESIRALLAADLTLMGYLTGGIYETYRDGNHPIRRDNPNGNPFSEIGTSGVLRVNPFAVIWTNAEPAIAMGEGQETWIHIRFYQERGYDQIVFGQRRSRALLENKKIVVSGKGHMVYYVDNGGQQEELGVLHGDPDRPLSMSLDRYRVVGRRL